MYIYIDTYIYIYTVYIYMYMCILMTLNMLIPRWIRPALIPDLSRLSVELSICDSVGDWNPVG